MVHKFSGIVKRQLDYWKYQVAHYGPDHPRYRPAKITKYEHLIREFSELQDYLDSLPDQESVDNPARAPQVVERGFQSSFFRPKPKIVEPVPAAPVEPEAREVPDNLADLPPELLKELSESVRGETDTLIKIINGRGGMATLDEILIDLYRKYGEIGKRNIISNKLYRLSKRGQCWALPGKKGLYTTTPVVDPATVKADHEKDDGSDSFEPEPSSSGIAGPPAASAKPSASSKTRRDLFATTAIPSLRVPQ